MRRITSAINIALSKAKADRSSQALGQGQPYCGGHHRGRRQNARTLLETILQAARNHDRDIVDVRSNENWLRLKTLVPVAPYCERDGLELLKEEIEAENDGVEVSTRVWWLKPWAQIRQHQPKMATVLFSVRDRKQAL